MNKQRKTATSKKVAAATSPPYGNLFLLWSGVSVTSPVEPSIPGADLLPASGVESFSVGELKLCSKINWSNYRLMLYLTLCTDDVEALACLVSETEIAVTCSTLKLALPVPFLRMAS